MNKITTNHAFTKRQLNALNKELSKISNTEIVALRGVNIPAKANYTDIDILHSPFSLDVYLSFMDISTPDKPKSNLYAIALNGSVDYNIRATMKFDSLSDRVNYFSNLEEVEFNK